MGSSSRLTITVLALLVICLFGLPVQGALYSGGGTEPDPYIIDTAAEMNDIGNNPGDWGSYFVLTDDINLADYTGTQFNIIGTFDGVFDGNGHVISNFTYNTTGTLNIGLFRFVRGKIKNLGLLNPNVIAGSAESVGSLVGWLLSSKNSGIITNCYVIGGSVSGNDAVGGLVGRSSGIIFGCYATCAVQGDDNVGGLVGIRGAYLPEISTIINCYSTGSVSGTTDVGGLVGKAGGWTGFEPGTITGSFWDTQSSGQPTSDGGTGKTTAQMQDPNTFIAAGWDFVDACDGPSDIWAEPNGGGYPILWCQLSSLPSLPNFAGGSGTTDDPYLITTANHLNSIGHNPRLMEKHFKFSNDVNLAGINFFVIGQPGLAYTSVFDGNNYGISNLTHNSIGKHYIGIFGYAKGAVIKDLKLSNCNISAGTGDYIGSLVGWLNNGLVINCCVTGGSVSGNDAVGGLVGWANGNGSIYNCSSSAGVSGGDNVGGLVGVSYDGGTISNCTATGGVVANNTVGGLVGFNLIHYGTATISDSYAGGDVDGTDNKVGGLVGQNSGRLSNCQAMGNIDGDNSVGGLVGQNNDTIVNCVSSGNVDGNVEVGGLAGYNYGMGGSIISNSYSTGNVWGIDKVGGLVGRNYDGGNLAGNDAIISKSYSTGYVWGTTNVGGLLGHGDDTITDSFWDVNTSGQSSSVGGSGAMGKTTAEMQTKSTFTDAGWDFVDEIINGTDDIWDICEGTNYPKLAWQIPLLGDFVCPDGVESNDLAVLVEEWLLEKLSADVAPDGGDGFVDFLDWAVFANGWQSTTDINDLTAFANQWLRLNAYSADIAPVPDGDGVVNLLDFATLAENWLAGI